MKALAVVPQPFFTPRGTPISVYYRTLVMAELGVEIDLLTYGEGCEVEIPGVRIIRIPRFRFLGSVRPGPSALKLFLDLVLVLRALPLLAGRRYDFVHAHEEAVFFFRALKPLFRFKLVYDMHSCLPQQLVNFEFTSSRLLVGLFRWLERVSLEGSDAVITVCPELARSAAERLQEPGRHFLIENTLFGEIRFPDHGSRIAGTEVSGVPDNQRPIVAYAGTFQPYQGIDLLIPAFARVRERRPDAFLLMVGGRPAQVERYRRMAIELGMDGHCLFTGMLDPTTARRYLRRATVVVSPRDRGTNTPMKIYEHLANGIPLVATRVVAHTQVLDDDICFLVDADPDSLARGVLEALDDEARRREVVARARARYSSEYSRERYVEKMRHVLEVLS
ncbi:MAG: glycosyltransferase family 4 protein [Gemmatimonadota bacterium]